MPLNFNELTLRDFSAGITDKFIDAPLNQLKQALNFLITENGTLKTRPGSQVYFDQDALIRIMQMFDLNDDLLVFRGEQLYFYNPVGPTLDLLSLPNGAAPFFQNTSSSSYVNGIKWRDQILMTNEGLASPTSLNRPMKAFRDDTNTLRGLELGLRSFVPTTLAPSFSGDVGFDVQLTGGGGRNEVYIWAFHYSYEYNIGDTTYQTEGPVYYTDNWFSNYVMGNIADAGNQISVTWNNIPQIDSSNSQIDGANTTIKIFRTVSGGTSFFQVGEVPFGTLTFFDNVSDTDLVNNVPLYANGGVLDAFPAPKCKFVTVVNDTPYYAYTEDETSGEIKPYRVVQGNPGSDTHHPSAFRDFDDEVRGISNVNGFPILFTNSYIYRLEGSFDNTGGGGIRARVISETVGVASHNSIVRANNLIYFIGKNNGVYLTDGYNVRELPASLTLFDTVRNFLSPEVRAFKIDGTYDFINERVYWAVGDNETENNQWLILNLKTGGLTLADGKTFFSSSILFKNNAILRGDDNGYIYEHKDGYQSDVVRDIALPASQWQTTHIPWALETIAFDYGSPAVTKWVPYVTTSVKSDTNYAIDIVSNNDDERVVKDLKGIRSWGTFFWGDPTFVWGNPETKWKKQETESHKRHFPKGTMRCRRKQVRYEPGDVIVYKSDNYALADAAYVNPLEPLDLTLTLQGASQWPSDAEGYFITFEETGYVTRHTILSVSGATATIGGGNLLPGTSKKWQIVGKYKNQEVEFKTITTRFAPLADEGNEFKTGDSGGNA
jgi:hypothetical protein